ncbi:MAG TPA: efflux transporter outer membrane subunit [Burkholderiales bacterium]|nr:efflux transporter outer membrane subunit [Burkholderiales bacterium]
MRIAARAFVLATALALSACQMFPAYKRPEVKVPETFRGQTGPAGEKSIAETAWWEIYRDPILEKLIRVALEQNYDIRLAIARVDEFRALAGVAGLGSVPLISAGGSAGREAFSTVGPTPYPTSIPSITQAYGANVVASYEVDLWRRIADLQDAAKAQLFASEFARETTRITVISSVATAYFALRSLDRQLLVTQRTLAYRMKFVELTRAQFRRGVVSGLDVNRAEANLAAARAAVPVLQSQIAQAENLIQVLLGQNAAPVLRGEPTETAFFPVPPEVPGGIPATLLQRRPDLQLAEYNLIDANAQLKSVKASLFPTISLTAAAGSSSALLRNLFTGPARTWSWALGFLQPIIDPNRNLYQVDAYSARERQAIILYQQAVVQAFREVADALAAREGFTAALSAQEDQVRELREASQRVLKRYAAGYSSYFEVIDADSSLFTAELLLAQAYQNSLVSFVQLYKALGGGWDVPKPGEAPGQQ